MPTPRAGVGAVVAGAASKRELQTGLIHGEDDLVQEIAVDRAAVDILWLVGPEPRHERTAARNARQDQSAHVEESLLQHLGHENGVAQPVGHGTE